ncbi:hypothetical protein B0H13DRAFT_2301465 [Mycena leptocephala]|nr:hypothetical protein B0H13DRAFT_2301465 [Mycena leptocephala]
MVFSVLQELIQEQPGFTNKSEVSRTPVDEQLAVTLYRLVATLTTYRLGSGRATYSAIMRYSRVLAGCFGGCICGLNSIVLLLPDDPDDHTRFRAHRNDPTHAHVISWPELLSHF